jgi:FAD-linked oxidoreductase
MPNLPDINKQTLGGAIATGTHGTGHGLTAIHGKLLDLTLATPDGNVQTIGRDANPDLFAAARVNLGAFGLVTRMTLANQSLARVKKTVTLMDKDALLTGWPQIRIQHRNAEFYLIPFTDRGILITHDVTTDPVRPRGIDHDNEGVVELRQVRDLLQHLPWLRRRVLNGVLADTPPDVAVDEGWKLLSNERGVPFNEMEYHLPLANQIDALREVVTAIETHRRDVFFPIEARIIAPDDAWLSPFYDRECGSVAVHAWFKDDYSFLFELVEPIFRKHGGRPHWGKLNSLAAADFRALYPRFDDAARMRAQVDPQGRMLNPYLRKVFGV